MIRRLYVGLNIPAELLIGAETHRAVRQRKHIHPRSLHASCPSSHSTNQGSDSQPHTACGLRRFAGA